MKLKYLLFFFLFTVAALGQTLKPGDGVRVTFFNITDNISGDYYIQKDFNIQLPFVGLVNVYERAFEEIKSEIVAKYDSLYRDPELTVQPLFRINILGEVREPGFYFVTGVEKLSDLIAQAGGETPDADLNEIHIVRENEEYTVDGEEIIAQGNRISDIGLQSGDRVFVSRSWWVDARNTSIIISAVLAVVTIVGLFIR